VGKIQSSFRRLGCTTLLDVSFLRLSLSTKIPDLFSESYCRITCIYFIRRNMAYINMTLGIESKYYFIYADEIC
jgi:hypothetical protein